MYVSCYKLLLVLFCVYTNESITYRYRLFETKQSKRSYEKLVVEFLKVLIVVTTGHQTKQRWAMRFGPYDFKLRRDRKSKTNLVKAILLFRH